MMRTVSAQFKGIGSILLNNPQTCDPLSEFSKEKKKLTSKRSKTDEIHHQIKDIEIRSKLYWEDGQVVVPSTWVLASIAKASHSVCKLAAKKARSAVFVGKPFLPLYYDGLESVKSPIDIVQNERFQAKLLVPQQRVRLAKYFPCFKGWSFDCDIDYDDEVITFDDLSAILNYVGRYGGFGDFRPTYGRCDVEIKQA